MKALILLITLTLPGCGVIPYLQAHAAQVAIIGATAGAISATEGAVVNGISLEKDIKGAKQQ